MRKITFSFKSLLLAAGLCVGANAWATGSSAGTDDNKTGWWTDWTDVYTLAGYGTYNLTFTTTNSVSGTSYHTWSVVVTNGAASYNDGGGTEYFALRGDGYAWQYGTYNSNVNSDKLQSSNDYATKNPSGSGIQSAMNGATVNMAVTRKSGNISVVANVTPTSENPFTMTFNYLIGDATSDNLGIFFTVDNAYVNVTAASKAITSVDGITATSTAMKPYTKYEFVAYTASYRASLKAGGTWDYPSDKPKTPSAQGFNINDKGRYMTFTLDQALVAGDVISINAYSTTTSIYNRVGLSTGFVSDMEKDCNVKLSFPSGYNTTDMYKLSYTVTAGDDFEGRTKIYVGLGNTTNTSRFINISSVNVTTSNASEIVVPQQLTGRTSWDFEDMSAASYTTSQFFDNLYVGASSDYPSGIVSDSRTVSGTAYTKALILNKHDLGVINGDGQVVADVKGCVMVRLPEGNGIVRLTYYNNGSAGYLSKCFSEATGGSRDNVATLATNGSGTVDINYTSSNSRNLYLYIRGDYITQIYIYKIEVIPTVAATIGDYGYTTFSSSYPLDLANMSASTGDVTAYYAKAVGAEAVTLSSIEADVEAGEGLVLAGTAGATITIPYATTDGSDIDNYLVGCPTGATLTANSSYYVLVNNTTTGQAEFQSLEERGATIPAGKAYLNAASANVKALRVVFDGEATGIAVPEVAEKAENGVLYNLNGQQVTADYKGIVIKNGKKFLNK